MIETDCGVKEKVRIFDTGGLVSLMHQKIELLDYDRDWIGK